MEIVGIGNALMDVIAFVDEEFAPSLGFHNNTTTHLDRPRLDSVLSLIPEPLMIAGGGAANTARVAALLGIKSTFLGSIGEDSLGERYRLDLKGDGVEVMARLSPRKTGVFLSLTRPDGGRTVLVAPGAALDISLEPPPAELFKKGALLYLEGFLLRDRGFFLSCLESARRADMIMK